MYKKNMYKFIRFFIIIALLFQCVLVGAEGIFDEEKMEIHKDIANRPQYVEGEYIIKYKDRVSHYEKVKLYKNENINLVEALNETNADLVNIKSSFGLDRKVKRLQRNPDVEYIEPNYLYYSMEIPINEPRFNELWGLKNTGQEINKTKGTEGIDIDILNAWEYIRGIEDVVVAVIDTGIDIAHPDLKDRIWTNTDEVLNGQDSDGNGYIDDIHGWDFLNGDNTVYDMKDGDFHGTHVAGILAASLNDMGVVGVAPEIKIMPLKFLGLNEYGESVGTLSDVLKAIDYAKERGVKIVNASWGNYEYSEILEDAIANSGMLFFVASGNETINTDLKPSYPASFNLPNIMSIGAINSKGEYTKFSNYGIETVHVAAPGDDILSTIPLTRYGGAAIFNETDTYKTLYQAFGLEILEVEQERLGIVSNIMSTMNVNKEDSILLVQDDESDKSTYKNCLEYYKKPLEQLGFENLEIYKVNQHENGPDIDKLKNYDLIVWFTGEGFGTFNGSTTVITNIDQENLIKYLDNGGKLYLSGRDAGEKIEETKFYTEYLGAKFISQIASIDENEGKRKNIIIGKEGTIFEQNTYKSSNTYLADVISPSNDRGKVAMVYGNGNKFSDSYMYSGGTSMATPYVSGIAALLYSLGDEDLLSIKSLIMIGARHVDGLETKTLTGGMVNATNSIGKYLSGETSYVRGIDLGVKNLELDTEVYNEYIFEPIINPLEASDKRIRWLSSNEDVAVVDEIGRIAVAGNGETIITGITLDGGYRDSCKVIVKEPVYPVKTVDIKTYDVNEIEKQYFDRDEIVNAKVKFIGNLSKNGIAILQIKDSQGRPYKLAYEELDFSKGKEQYAQFEFKCKDEGEQKIEIYFWDSLENMKPLAEKAMVYIN